MGRRQLESRLGSRYEWHGDSLGGRVHGRLGPTESGLDWLLTEVADEPTHTALMCLEEAPGDCHRHHLIAVPLIDRGIDILHVYQDQIVSSYDLAISMTDGSGEYPYFRIEDWDDILAELAA